MSVTKYLSILLLAVWVRYSLRFSAYYDEISKRVEISSPVNSWTRAIEGVHLKKNDISPYAGDTFHESPIFLFFYKFIETFLCENLIALLFIAVDVGTALILGIVASTQLQMMKDVENRKLEIALQKNVKLQRSSFESLVITQNAESVRFWTQNVYLLCPYSILSCVGQSTSIFSNFLLTATLLLATTGKRFLSLFILSLLSVNSFYPVIFLPAIILILEQKYRFEEKTKPDQDLEIQIDTKFVRISMLISFLIFATFTAINLFLCQFLDSWTFFDSVYGFLVKTAELSPNIGLFWYFFTEMFDHFREFFLWVFQINSFIFVIPLTFKFWRNPFFLALAMLFLQSLFKPFPTISDIVLYLALLPQWNHLFEHMKSILVVSVIFALVTVFLPVQWYLWIVLETANSNFYFGMTLAYNIAQIFLVTDLMFAYVKRQFFFDNLRLYELSKKTGQKIQIKLGE